MFRLVNTLKLRGFLAQTPDSKSYTLGSAVWRLADLIPWGQMLKQLAREQVTSLVAQTGESAHVVIRLGAQAVFVDYDRGQLEELLGRGPLPFLTKRTLCLIDALAQECQRSKRRGYALDDKENHEGVRCFAAAVRDSSGEVVAAIGISGPAERLPKRRWKSVGQAVKLTGRESRRETGLCNTSKGKAYNNNCNHRENAMSERDSKKITRRQAAAASLGTAGLAAVGATEALAQPRASAPLKGKRVLVAIGDFSEGLETYYIIYRLIEEGVVPVVAAAEVKRLQMVVHDFDPKHSNYIEMTGYCIQTDVAYRDVKPAEYDALVIPGGRGPEEIRQNKDALAIVGYFIDKKLPLGAMCHGPQVITAARSVKGRRMTGFGGIRVDIELAGAKFIDQRTVVDGAMVTSGGWPDLPDFMPKFLKVLAAH